MNVRRAALPLFWILLIVVFLIAVSPAPPQLLGDFSDKTRHVLAFMTLAGFAKWVFPNVSTGRIFAGLFIYGAAIELVQSVPLLHRDPSIADLVADIAAIASALLLATLVRRLLSERTPA